MAHKSAQKMMNDVLAFAETVDGDAVMDILGEACSIMNVKQLQQLLAYVDEQLGGDEEDYE